MSKAQPDEKLDNILQGLGEVLQHLRVESNLTQRQAAKLADTTQARISDLENAKADVFVSTLVRMAKAYRYELEINFVPVEDEEAVSEVS
jgi:transcriptional regulator with XRE-family HTH domain